LFYYLGANIGQGEMFEARTLRRMSSGAFIMKPDRFVSQRADDHTGWVLTKEFVLRGSKLTINAQVDGRPGPNRGGGRIRVEVLRHPPLGHHADDWVETQNSTYAFKGFSLDDCQPIGG